MSALTPRPPRPLRSLTLSLPALLLLLCSGAPAGAVPTATFKASTFEDLDKGEPKGTFISSTGEVVAGRGLRQIKTDAAMIWSTVTAPDGTVYFGTGDQGLLLAVRNDKLRTVAKLKTVLITSLALGPRGSLLAGTMPDARILEIDPRSGKWKQLAKLPAEHVWALLYDARAGRIYAASGSPGKIFAIPAGGGKPEVHYDPGEKHLLCLAREPRGTLLTGSSDKAILYRVLGKGKGTALQDFDANELRDVVVSKDGTIHVGVNKFTLKTSGLPRFDATKDGEEGTVITVESDSKKKTKSSKVRPQELRPGAKEGKGAVYRVDPATGNADQLLALEKGYVTDLALDAADVVWAGEGTMGKVYLLRRDRTVLTAFDVDERQVLALAVEGKEQYLGTGDAGAIYRVGGGKPVYLSEVFDAKYPAHWGSLHFQSTSALRFESRSGNTAKPDDTWSAFKPTQGVMAGVVKIGSPPGRYLRLRVSWPGAAGALRSFIIYHLPVNQRAQVTEITFEIDGDDKDKKKPRTPKIKIKWKVENPDKDPLVYRVYARDEMGLVWRKISGVEPLEKEELEWDTEPVADGYYRIRVVASDERGNSPETTSFDELISARLLVDNRRPEVMTMVVRHPWVSGLARDSYSPISRIEYSLNSKPWRLVGCLDGIYDNPTEAFRFALPLQLKKGTHTLAVRTVDEAGNMGVTQVTFVR